MKFGDAFVEKYDRSSLNVLVSVGEPINPEPWLWYYKVVGNAQCPIVDTYWQTETGGIVLTPLPGATPLKPGSATLPFFGIAPALLDKKTGKEIEFKEMDKAETETETESKDDEQEQQMQSGILVIKRPWPGRIGFWKHSRNRLKMSRFWEDSRNRLKLDCFGKILGSCVPRKLWEQIETRLFWENSQNCVSGTL